MKTNIVHSVLVLLNILLGSIVAFDWTSIGLSQSTATTVAGIVVMLASAVTAVLNWSGNGATGAAKPKQ